MAKLLSAFGYQGDAMNLPVKDVDASLSYYIEKMGFSAGETSSSPHKKVVLERDGIQMALAENGADPEQDGCAFYTDDVESLHAEFLGNALEKIGELGTETKEDGTVIKRFFVIAPDGLCYWFGEKE